MNTKLSVTLLSGLSLFMSVGAFAVSDSLSSDELNWSYVMGGTKPMDVASADTDVDTDIDSVQQEPVSPKADITCTEGCPGRPVKTQEPLVLTYEDEAMPLADRVETVDSHIPTTVNPSFPVRESERAQAQPVLNPIPQVETRYVSTPTKTQYPITRQYPISVEYPVTVQRNMTVEQPVLMQQPVIVRRPVVMQQDITVQRQPTIVQGQPMVMQQQPAFVQGQPVFVQAPAATLDFAMLGQMGAMNTPTLPTAVPTNVTLPAQSIPMPQQPVIAAPMMVPQQTYQPTFAPNFASQYSMPTQPTYQGMPPMYLSVPMTQPMAMPFQQTAVAAQQPTYQN